MKPYLDLNLDLSPAQVALKGETHRFCEEMVRSLT